MKMNEAIQSKMDELDDVELARAKKEIKQLLNKENENE
jgi:hypothetical protein